ncbi:MAG: hypothetical protein L6Q37_01110 [Bdellovibrionaceae bacterium]|nr:hypothetical protein [Pseudobdellovibrionaceae bacterium]NUM58290.1 hypothetical protein [Pseudobdellovibrionaceae bacterium]
MAKFEFKKENSNATEKIAMSGIIDEDVDFNILKLSDTGNIEIDLKNLKSINSCGIREWIKWLSSSKNSQINFVNCPKIIVDQINMVDGFLPTNAIVSSFFVPYYNEENGTEKNILFRLGHEYSQNGLNSPAKVTDDSGAEMEMDVIESKYFKFIKK